MPFFLNLYSTAEKLQIDKIILQNHFRAFWRWFYTVCVGKMSL